MPLLRNKIKLLVTLLIFALLLTLFVLIQQNRQNQDNDRVLGVGTTYYVSTTGNDTHLGTSVGTAWRTIQKCLTQVQAGETCLVQNGTYNEALTLINSGNISSRITLSCATNKGCTVNSGSSQTLVAGENQYYTIDGFRFLSITVSDSYYSIDLRGHWIDDLQGTTGGNAGFILRNSYIEGAVDVYGHNNLIENCEINGLTTFGNGIRDRFASSHDNTYQNNTIYDFIYRAVWSMKYTDNIFILNNHLYNITNTAVDCDSAVTNQTRCFVRNNTIHDTTEGGILFENCFNCAAEGNTIYNTRVGISTINYGNSSDPLIFVTEDGVEYRTIDTNSVFSGNVIYNVERDGIRCDGSPGGTATNNTIYRINLVRNYFGGIGLAPHEAFYCNNWVIKNNLIASPNAAALFFESGASGLSNVTTDYNYFDITTSASKFTLKRAGVDTNYTLAQWKLLPKDTHSTIRSQSSTLFTDATNGNFHLQNTSEACSGGEGGTYRGAYPCVTPTPTVTATTTPTATPTSTPTPTVTVTPTPTPTIPAALNNVYFTFAKFRYNKYASPTALRAGDTAYIKNFDQSKLRLLQVFLYDYEKKGNQGYTKSKVTSTSMFLRTNYNLPTGKRYAYVMKFQDKTTSIIATKYFVVYTTKTWLGKSVL